MKQVQPNSVTNRLIPRRLLISSAETGGNTPWQPNKRNVFLHLQISDVLAFNIHINHLCVQGRRPRIAVQSQKNQGRQGVA